MAKDAPGESRRRGRVFFWAGMAAAIAVVPATTVAVRAGGPQPAGSQEPASRPPDLLLPISTELVRIDVVVSDKGGHPRTGLKPQDFVVLEDGQPQDISQFEAFVSQPRPGPPAPGAPPPAEAGDEDEAPARTTPPRRYVVLAVDDVHIEAGNLLRVKKALDRFLEREVGPEDLIALITTSGTRSIFQEFTDDRSAIRWSVARLSVQDRTVETRGVPYITEYQAEQIARGDPEALRVAVEEVMAAGLFRDAESAEDQARVAARLVLAESTNHARITLETLDNLVRSLSELQGRKVVALVSDGFLAGLTTGANSAFDIRRITDACTRAGVVLYALDTRGLVATSVGRSASSRMPMLVNTFSARDIMIRQSEHATRDAMSALAGDSGGFLVEGTNDLGAGLRRILKDTETYYAVAYESKNTKRDGSFRRVEVRLPGERDVRIRARKGYFAPDDRRALSGRPTPAPPPGEPGGPVETLAPPADDGARSVQASARSAEARRDAEMRQALTSVVPQAGIPVRLSADFVSIDGAGPEVVVSSLVDLKEVPFARTGDRHVATVDAAATVFDESGAVVGSLQTEHVALQLTDESYDLAKKKGLQYQKAAPVKPGRYRVRFAVREDGGGKVGSASQWVQVPDLADGKLTLSSLFLLTKEDASGETANPPPDGSISLRGVQALRRYGREETLYVQLFAYNPRRDASGATDLVTQAEIWRGGQLLGSSVPESMAPGDRGAPPSPHTRSIKLHAFEPGDYEVRVVVTDRNAHAVASRRAGFAID